MHNRPNYRLSSWTGRVNRQDDEEQEGRMLAGAPRGGVECQLWFDDDPSRAGLSCPSHPTRPVSAMHRFFNTAGPVRPGRHYCVPPLERFDLDEVLGLIRNERYFVLRAPRQSGKTSSLLALRDLLNSGAEGDYRCAYINVETAQTAREDVGRAMGAIAVQIAGESEDTFGEPAFAEKVLRYDAERRPHSALWALLRKWARAGPPLVLMIDEIDAMVGDSVVSVLRQLRTGYANRPKAFPQSVILCGVRDVRDYRIRANSEKEVITGGSAFNIKAESLRLGDFTRADVRTLVGQHTAETGQAFEPGALEVVWTQTRGQPWFVNALARELCFWRERPVLRDRPISERDVFGAREALILRRDTHIDQLADKLREPRVRRVVEPLLAGGEGAHSEADSDYVRDLGLVAADPPLRVANPIYAEVLPRVLTSVLQDEMPQQPLWYVDPDGAGRRRAREPVRCGVQVGQGGTLPCAHGRAGTGADRRRHGRERDRRRPPGRLRHAPGTNMGREGVPGGAHAGRRGDRSVGGVTHA